MRETAGRLFVWGTYVVAIAVVVQFLLAGLGVFADSEFLRWHATVNGAIVGLLPLVLVLVGWLGGVPVRLRWLMAAIFGLTVLQSLLLFPYHMDARGAALHLGPARRERFVHGLGGAAARRPHPRLGGPPGLNLGGVPLDRRQLGVVFFRLVN